MHDPPIAQAGPSARPQLSGRRLTIALFAAVAFLYWASLYLYVPTLPTYVQSKSQSLALVGVVLSMYGLWQAIIRLPLGISADWLGQRKPFIVGGLALAGLGAWILGTADGVTGLAVGRAITGLAAGTWVPLVVIFSTLFPPDEAVRASTLLTLVGSIGRLLATSLTGSLNQLSGYPLAFYLAAGASVLAVLFVIPVREKPHQPQHPSVADIGSLITRRDVLLPSLLTAVTQYANHAVSFGFIPILARQLGATDITQSMLMSSQIGVTMLGTLAAAATLSRIGARRLVILSFILLSTGIGVAALASSLSPLFLSQFCIGLSMGISYPVLMGMSIRYVKDAERTTAMGLFQSVYAIGMFSGPWVSGWLAEALGIRPMFGVTAFFCLALGLLVNRHLTAKQDHEA